jgi:hypothetical protein
MSRPSESKTLTVAVLAVVALTGSVAISREPAPQADFEASERIALMIDPSPSSNLSSNRDSRVPGHFLPLHPGLTPRIARKPPIGTISYESGAWLLSRPGPAGFGLSRTLPHTRESLPAILLDDE